MSAKDPNQDFGANEWLVDEMYERYLSDPTSLEPSWIEFFKTYNPSNNSSGLKSGSYSLFLSKGSTIDSLTDFLPFNLTLTMDGLSGMKIFNKFKSIKK